MSVQILCESVPATGSTLEPVPADAATATVDVVLTYRVTVQPWPVGVLVMVNDVATGRLLHAGAFPTGPERPQADIAQFTFADGARVRFVTLASERVRVLLGRPLTLGTESACDWYASGLC